MGAIFKNHAIISSRDRDADALVRLALDDDDASSKPAIEGVAVAVTERASRESGGGERGRWGRRPRPRTTDADR